MTLSPGDTLVNPYVAMKSEVSPEISEEWFSLYPCR